MHEKADRKDSNVPPLEPHRKRRQTRLRSWLRVEMAILLAALVAVAFNADRLAAEFRTMTGLGPDQALQRDAAEEH